VDDVRVADRIALRALVDGYAQGADRRRPDQVAAQFTPDGVLTICTDPDGEQVRAERRGSDEIAAAMRGLDRYPVTAHHVGQQLLDFDADDPDVAQGETYCEAHHWRERDGVTVDRVMWIRYQDTYVRTDGTWLIAHRRLLTDWTEDREVRLALPS
jgi:SnoaL-like domain